MLLNADDEDDDKEEEEEEEEESNKLRIISKTSLSRRSCPSSGLFCENPPPMILLQTSPCDQSECQNSAQCLLVAGEPVCRCMPGFYGNKCDKMATVHFLGREAYVELPGAKLRPNVHISFQVCLHFIFYNFDCSDHCCLSLFHYFPLSLFH